MGAIIKPFMPKPRPVPNLKPKMVYDPHDVKTASADPKAPNFNPNYAASVSPDTDVVNEGVNKIIKKGKASTIVTGVMGDISKPNVFKPLLGGGS
jgi:hypothetical protein|tara:strand:- start:1783 stop:2067 length:285 start_codon:yes stop_codon:yes gene_type:complete